MMKMKFEIIQGLFNMPTFLEFYIEPVINYTILYANLCYYLPYNKNVIATQCIRTLNNHNVVIKLCKNR